VNTGEAKRTAAEYSYTSDGDIAHGRIDPLAVAPNSRYSPQLIGRTETFGFVHALKLCRRQPCDEDVGARSMSLEKGRRQGAVPRQVSPIDHVDIGH
jgi:hypothetical protein